MSVAPMEGKVVVMTGATSGIGFAAARAFASLGASIVLVARSQERAERTRERLQEASPNPTMHRVRLADLSLVADTIRVSSEIARETPRIDVLVNNAGGLYFSKQVTGEGLERTFALNHMSYFLMADGILSSLGRGSRIVNTASEAHRSAPPTLDDLPEMKDSGFRAYSRTKAFNILFTRALARRVSDSGIAVHCFHPGFVPTRLFGEQGWRARTLKTMAHLIGVSVERGADTLVYLAATDDALESGEYYSKRKLRKSTAFTSDPDAAERLWSVSEEIRSRYARPSR